MNHHVRIGLTLTYGLAAFACGGDHKGSGDPTGTGETKTAVIGATGGTLANDDATLTVPANALAQDTELSITSTTSAAPTGYDRYSPIYDFGPEGLTFAEPVTIELAFTGDANKATLFWSVAGNRDAFEALEGTVSGGSITAQVTHFSLGFVGAIDAPTSEDVPDGSSDSEDDTAVIAASVSRTGVSSSIVFLLGDRCEPRSDHRIRASARAGCGRASESR